MTEIKKAEPLGRLIRLLLGVATLSLFAALVGPLRAALWSGEVPAHWSFYIALGFGLYLTSFVARILANRAWGQKPLVVALLGAAAAAAVGYLTHGTPLAPPLGVYVWGWLVAFTVLLGCAHILARPSWAHPAVKCARTRTFGPCCVAATPRRRRALRASTAWITSAPRRSQAELRQQRRCNPSVRTRLGGSYFVVLTTVLIDGVTPDP